MTSPQRVYHFDIPALESRIAELEAEVSALTERLREASHTAIDWRRLATKAMAYLTADQIAAVTHEQ